MTIHAVVPPLQQWVWCMRSAFCHVPGADTDHARHMPGSDAEPGTPSSSASSLVMDMEDVADMEDALDNLDDM